MIFNSQKSFNTCKNNGNTDYKNQKIDEMLYVAFEGHKNITI
jgi:hypothetical protein